MLEGRGDEIPVSLMPVDGTWPSGTAAFEKRNIADDVPVWDADLCIQCGQCSFVCPHSVIRAKYFDRRGWPVRPASFQSAPVNARGYPDVSFSLAVLCGGLHRVRPRASKPVRPRAQSRPASRPST